MAGRAVAGRAVAGRGSAAGHLRRAKDWMDAHHAEPLDVDQLAAAAHYSRYHFMRSFAAAYVESPKAYLTRRRIERAKDLLRSVNLTVTEVCLAVGFTSLGTFSRRFSELVGGAVELSGEGEGVRTAARAGLLPDDVDAPCPPRCGAHSEKRAEPEAG